MQVVRDNMRSSKDRRAMWLIILITLLGFAVRVINLGGDSFWFDEHLSNSSPSRRTTAAGNDDSVLSDAHRTGANAVLLVA